MCSNAMKSCDLDGAYGLLGVKINLHGDFLFEGGLLSWVQTNSPTSARHGNDLGYIKI